MTFSGNPRPARARGTVLVIVLWIALGLVSITLYFGHTMLFEFRSSDNATAAVEAEQAIEGAARYVLYLLSNPDAPGVLPDVNSYSRNELPVGDANFWFIGRNPDLTAQMIETEPHFSIVDEGSKLNLNTVTAAMVETLLEQLGYVSAELAASIIDWRDTDDTPGTNGAETETYSRLAPAYSAKNARFDSVDELRMVHGALPELIYGEDANRNGILDPNEDDGDLSPPADNRDGQLNRGLIEFFTVFSRAPNKRIDGSALINVTRVATQTQGGQGGAAGGGDAEAEPGNNVDAYGQPLDLLTLLNLRLGQDRAEQIIGRFGNNTTNNSVLQFFARSGMTTEEFDEISGDLTVSTNDFTEGLINVNTASEVVLACVPGIGAANAAALVARRQQNATSTNSVAWVAEVLDQNAINQAGPYLTDRSYQYSADVAAVGRHGRGYRRVQFVFDAAEGVPKIVYRRDLTGLGWALGRPVRERILYADRQSPDALTRSNR